MTDKMINCFMLQYLFFDGYIDSFFN